MTACPCGSQLNYDQCCGQFISGAALPSTVEQLMRSRYTAFYKKDLHYIAQTMKPPASDDFHADYEDTGTWLKLEVIRSEQNGDEGLVEYNARYKDDGMLLNLHEISLFKRLENKWYYTDNQSHEITKIELGRNDACLCGSGIKYKKCCGR